MNAIYWGETGRICCKRHGPYPGSDTWRSERWRPITPAEAAAFEREAGQPASCETCNAIAARHDEGRHAEQPDNECALCAEVAS
jgi:hypothetical protein